MGSLAYLSFKNAFKSYDHLENYFCQSLCISEKMHEEWYGEKKVANEMKGD